MTATNSLMLGGASGGTNGFGSFGDSFTPFSGSNPGVQAEANYQMKFQKAFTLAGIFSRVLTNTGGTLENVTSRKNGVNGNSAYTIPGNTTGWFSDSTHTDSFAAGDTGCIHRFNGNFNNTPWNLEGGISQGASAPVHFGAAFSTSGQSTPSSAAYYEVHGYLTQSGNTDSTDSRGQPWHAPFTWAHLGFKTSTAPAGGRFHTIISRRAAADGNQTVTNSGSTGWLNDSTHTDSVADGDKVCLKSSGTGTGSGGNWEMAMSDLSGSTSAHGVICTETPLTGYQAFNTTGSFYSALGGDIETYSTETNAKVVLPYAVTFKRAAMRILLNNSSTGTFKSRKYGADGNQAFSVTSGTTGNLEDSTHTDSYSAADAWNVLFTVASLTTLEMETFYGVLDDGTNTGAATYNDSVSESMSLADTDTGGIIFGGATSESMTLADSPAVDELFGGNPFETMSMSDAPSASCVFEVACNETMGLTDNPDGVLEEGAHGDTIAFVMS